jgi:hypothetical protein
MRKIPKSKISASPPSTSNKGLLDMLARRLIQGMGIGILF